MRVLRYEPRYVHIRALHPFGEHPSQDWDEERGAISQLGGSKPLPEVMHMEKFFQVVVTT